MQFLPANYQSPKAPSSYMKIQKGENKIRILSQPIIGWEDWDDKKPIRYRMDEKPDRSKNPEHPMKHFWAFIVWNYSTEQIEILNVPQAGIRKGIESLCNDQDWGAPFFYDIKITREGEELRTKYTVNPLPHRPTSQHIIEAFHEKPINLEALFDNKDPFSPENRIITHGIFIDDEEKKDNNPIQSSNKSVINESQVKEIQGILDNCDMEYISNFNKTLELIGAKSLDQIPRTYYENLKKGALQNMAEYQVSMCEPI